MLHGMNHMSKQQKVETMQEPMLNSSHQAQLQGSMEKRVECKQQGCISVTKSYISELVFLLGARGKGFSFNCE